MPASFINLRESHTCGSQALLRGGQGLSVRSSSPRTYVRVSPACVFGMRSAPSTRTGAEHRSLRMQGLFTLKNEVATWQRRLNRRVVCGDRAGQRDTWTPRPAGLWAAQAPLKARRLLQAHTQPVAQLGPGVRGHAYRAAGLPDSRGKVSPPHVKSGFRLHVRRSVVSSALPPRHLVSLQQVEL